MSTGVGRGHPDSKEDSSRVNIGHINPESGRSTSTSHTAKEQSTNTNVSDPEIVGDAVESDVHYPPQTQTSMASDEHGKDISASSVSDPKNTGTDKSSTNNEQKHTAAEDRQPVVALGAQSGPKLANRGGQVMATQGMTHNHQQQGDATAHSNTNGSKPEQREHTSAEDRKHVVALGAQSEAKLANSGGPVMATQEESPAVKPKGHSSAKPANSGDGPYTTMVSVGMTHTDPQQRGTTAQTCTLGSSLEQHHEPRVDQQAGKEQTISTVRPWTTLDNIDDVWKQLEIFIKPNPQAASVTIDTSDEIKPCMMQYALYTQAFHKRLKASYRLTATVLSSNKVELMPTHDIAPDRNLQEWICKCINNLLKRDSLIAMEIPLQSAEGGSALKTLEGNPPDELTEGLVAVYKDTSTQTLYFVGNEADVKNSWGPLTQHVATTLIPVEECFQRCLETFEYEKVCAADGVYLVILSGKLEFKAANAEKLGKAVKSLDDIKTKRLKLDNKSLALFKTHEGYDWLVKRMEEKNCQCHVWVDDQTTKMTLRAFDEATLKTAVHIVVESVDTVSCKKTVLAKIKVRLHKNQRFCGKYFLSDSGNAGEITVTSDLSKDLHALINEASLEKTQLTCSDAMWKFLQNDQGHKLLEELEKKHKVTVTSSEHVRVIHLQGKCNVRTARKELLQRVHTKTVHVKPSDWKYLQGEDVQKEIDGMADKSQTCWSMADVGSKTKQAQPLHGVAYRQVWRYTNRTGTLAVVEGDITDMDLDVVVHPVNDCLLPVKSSYIYDRGGDQFQSILRTLTSSWQGKPCNGTFLTLHNVGNLQCKFVAHLVMEVIERDNGGQRRVICPDVELANSLTKIFSQANDLGLTTVGLPVNHFNCVTMDPILKGVGDFLQKVQDNGHSLQQVYIFCPKYGLDQVINGVMSSAITKQAFEETDAKEWMKDEVLQGDQLSENPNCVVNVVSGNVFEQQVDCILLLVRQDLQLSEGILSKKFLQIEGSALQEVLNREYKDGIRLGEVICTKVQRMKCKHVFLAAIPNWIEEQTVVYLRQVMETALLKADELGLISFALPALGTGRPRYPYRDVAVAMFDVAHAFAAVNLEKVSFVVYDDDKTLKAFQSEHLRRQKLGHCHRLADTASMYPIIHTQIVIGGTEWIPDHTVTVNVVSQQHKKDVPSHAVDVTFVSKVTGTTSKECLLKRWATHPVTLTDTLEVVLHGQSEGDFVDAVRLFLEEVCTEERTTYITFNCIQQLKTVTIERQISLLTTQLSNGSVVPFHLSTVIVCVDPMQWTNVKDNLCSVHPAYAKESLIEKGFSMIGFRTKADSFDWTLKPDGHLQEDKFNIEAVALSDGQLQDFEVKFNTALEMKDAIIIDSVFEEVTAEINPGLVKFHDRNNDLESWVQRLERKFLVDIDRTDGGLCTVHGSLEGIANLETHLIRSLAESPDTMEETEPSGRFDEATSALKESDSSHSMLPSNDTDLHTRSKGKIVVQVYAADITRLAVDCIVSSTAGNISHRNGVAHVIATAAGQQYRTQCKELSKPYMVPGECRTTGGGHLKVNHVIHVCTKVSGDEFYARLASMRAAVLNVLNTADKSAASSIAMPCLFSGVGGQDPKLFAQEFFRALEEFSKCAQHITEVHLVDTASGTISDVSQILAPLSTQSIHFDTPVIWAGSERRGTKPKVDISNDGTNAVFHNLGGIDTCIIRVVIGDITTVKVDAVVCPEAMQPKIGKGGIATELRKLGGKKMEGRFKKLKGYSIKLCDVIESAVDGDNLQCKFILHAVVPRMNFYYIQHPDYYQRDMKATMKNILRKTMELGMETLAIPMLCLSDDITKYEVSVNECCKLVVRELLDFAKNFSTPRRHLEVHFINTDTVVHRYYIDVLKMESIGVYQVGPLV